MRAAGADGRKTQINFSYYFQRIKDQKGRVYKKPETKKGLKKSIVKKF